MVLPALIGAGGSLLGGLLGNRSNKKAIAAQNAYNDPSAIRARAEAAGFNPLLFVGPGVGNQQVAQQDMMGSAIADASVLLADGLARKAERLDALSQAEAQNRELRKQLNNAVLRPRNPGVFGTVQIPTIASVGRSRATVDGATPSQVSESELLGGTRYPTKVSEIDMPQIITPVNQGFEYGGDVIHWPVGPDVDSTLTGIPHVAIKGLKDWYHTAKRRYEITGSIANPKFQYGKLAYEREQRRQDRVDTVRRDVEGMSSLRFDPYHRDAYRRYGTFSAN